MMMPSIFGENLFDDFFDNSFRDFSIGQGNGLMKTDVKGSDGDYEIDMSLPGVNKEDIKAELKDGYLTVSAQTSNEKEDKDENKKYVRRERYYGSCSRSFYVGEQVKQEEIKARYENGVLTLNIPKKEPEKVETDANNYIAIEG